MGTQRRKRLAAVGGMGTSISGVVSGYGKCVHEGGIRGETPGLWVDFCGDDEGMGEAAAGGRGGGTRG